MDYNDHHQHDADDCVGAASGEAGADDGVGSGFGEALPRLEILTATQRRRTWPPEFKARVLAETFHPGANISAVARRHGVSVGLVHYWRKCVRDGGFDAGSGVGAGARFIPVVPTEELATASVAARHDGAISIEVHGAVIRLDGAVDEGNLAKVLSTLKVNY